MEELLCLWIWRRNSQDLIAPECLCLRRRSPPPVRLVPPFARLSRSRGRKEEIDARAEGRISREAQAGKRQRSRTHWVAFNFNQATQAKAALPSVGARMYIPSHIITTEERTAPPFDQNPSLRLATAPVAAVGDAAEVIRVNRTLFHTRTHAFSHNCLS